MNCKRFVLTAVISVAFLFGFDYWWHNILLMSQYEATSSLWRSKEEMGQLCHWGMLSTAAIAIILTYVYTLSCKNKGMCEGIKFGIVIGFLLVIISFSMYPYLPIPIKLAGFWALGSFLHGLGLGVICGVCYKNKD
jgi:hypothetical protein